MVTANSRVMKSARRGLPAVRQDVVPTARAPVLGAVTVAVRNVADRGAEMLLAVQEAPVRSAAVLGVMALLVTVLVQSAVVAVLVVPVPVIEVAMALVPGEMVALAAVPVAPAPNVAAVTVVPGQVHRVSGAVDPMAADPARVDRDGVVRWVPPRYCLPLPAMA